jgi:exodeoxyribonuclease V alpha subunit
MAEQAETYGQPNLEQLQGVVERLTFHSPESGYTIARLQVPRQQDLVTVTGNFASIQPGQTLKLYGLWREHPQYGPQFQVNRYVETKPATLTGIEKYLGSGLIKGVGPVTARRIVSHFGLQTLEIIEEQIERLIEVPGIGPGRVAMIRKTWAEQKSIQEVMLFLQGNSVSTTYAVKIFKQYGEGAIAVVSHNPYQLATDIFGIGFVTADTIARNLGIAPDSEFRYRSGLLHVLNEAGEEGHCYLPLPDLVQRSVERLALEEHRPEATVLETLIRSMAQQQELRLEVETVGPESLAQEHCYAPTFYQAETALAKRLQTLLACSVGVDLPRVQNWLERFMAQRRVDLSAEQQQAVLMAASQRVSILTGGPGCGKTFTTRTIVALWRAMGKQIALASPTGRAAQRLKEMTGQEAKTIHRLLEFDPGTMGFKRNQDNPLEADALIVDEASMLDLFLANSLLRAIAPKTQLLIVGDTDQLPSVGPGNILQDLIASGMVPVIRLTQVFRQAQASRIITNAHSINQGYFPSLERVSDLPQTDCLWAEVEEPENGVQMIRELFDQLIPALGLDPRREVQLLCPMARGMVGTRNLNQVAQALLNPPESGKAELQRGTLTLRVGDRVIQQVNDYGREVFNGDLGVIEQIDPEEQEVRVNFEGRTVTYDIADLNELSLAWAVTIHKSQGSEYPAIIMPLFTQHYLMLTRNLLYTGLTRAKRLAILVGPKRAIGLAVRQLKDRQRFTHLAQRLQGGRVLDALQELG